MRAARFALLLVLAAPSLAIAAGIGANTSQYIKSRHKPAARAAWKAVDPALASSSLRAVKFAGCGVDNAHALDAITAALRSSPMQPEYALAVVPGSSEGMGHHVAWQQGGGGDSHWVEPNFRSRLRHAFLLLLDGAVGAILISGGSIDAAHPDYNEAVYGYRELISEYGALYKSRTGGKLEDHVVVDPFAIHSEVNVRNGDRLTRLLGLDRNIVVTETGSMKRQGWWFTNAIGGFGLHCEKALGFKLGDMEELAGAPVLKNYAPKSEKDHNGVAPAQYLNSAGSHPEVSYIQSAKPPKKGEAVDTVAIAHFNLATTAQLMAGGDARWDLGQKDAEFGAKTYEPDVNAVNAACGSLGKKLK
jgi:hypothetical protein